MSTREFKACGGWSTTLMVGLMVTWLSGCGGGNDDFGPTAPARSPTANVPSNPAATTAPATNSTPATAIATKPVEAAAVRSETGNNAPTKSPETPETKPTAKTTSPEPSANSASRETPNVPMPVAKGTVNAPATDKNGAAQKGAPATSLDKPETPEATTPEVEQHLLTADTLAWLVSKRRQAVTHDGSSVLTAGDLAKVNWHDLRTGKLTREFFGRSGVTTGLGSDPGGHWIIGASEAGWVRLWTMEQQPGLDRFARQAWQAAQIAVAGFDSEQGGVRGLAVNPTGGWFVVAGEDGSLRKGLVEIIPPSPDKPQAEASTASPLSVRWEDKISGHAGPVTALRFSPDGAWLVTGGTDRHVRLWDTKTWKVVQTWSDLPTHVLDVSVSADGQIVAVAGLDKFARWWKVETPEPSDESSDAPANPEKPTKANAKPKAPVKKSSKKASKEDEEDAKPENGFEHPDLVLAVSVSADGKQIVTGCQDKVVRVWDRETGKSVEKHDGLKEAVLEVRLLDQDRRLLFADRAGNVRSKVRAPRSGNDDDDSPAPSEQTQTFATPADVLAASQPMTVGDGGGASGILALQNQMRRSNSREARAALRSELLPLLNPDYRDESAERAAELATLEKQLAKATTDSAKTTLKRQISRLKTAAVSLEKSERPKLIGTLTDVLPPTATGQAPASELQLSILADGELLAAVVAPTSVRRNDDDDENPRANAVAQSTQVRVWDVATQTPLRHWDNVAANLRDIHWLEGTHQLVTLSGHSFALPSGDSAEFGRRWQAPISVLGVAPDGQRLAVGFVGSARATSKVLQVLTASPLQEQLSHEAFESLVTSIAYSPDGTSLAVAIRERQVHRLLILDPQTLAVQVTVEEAPHTTPWLQGNANESRDRGLTTLLFSSDGRYLLTHGSYGPSDYRLTLWQKKGTKWSKETGINSKGSQPLIDDRQSPSPIWFVGGKGSQLAAITSKGLGIVDTSNGRILRTIERRDTGKNRSPMAWSADGLWVAQGDDVGNVTLWSLRTDKEAAIFQAQLGPVNSIALSPDGRTLATLGEENKLHLWNLDGWQPKNRVAAKPKGAKPQPSAAD